MISVFLMILWLSGQTSMFFLSGRFTMEQKYENTWRFLQLPYSERKTLSVFCFFLWLRQGWRFPAVSIVERRCWKEAISWTTCHCVLWWIPDKGYGSINLIRLWKDFVCRRGRLTGWDYHFFIYLLFCFICVAKFRQSAFCCSGMP